MQRRLKLYRGKWAIVWSEGGSTRRVSTGETDHARAEIYLREFEHRLAAAQRPAGPLTVGGILDAYFEDHPGVIHRPALVAWWRSRLPDHVNDDTVKEYLASRKGKAASTLRSEVAILQTALNYAVRKCWLTAVPSLELPDPSPPREGWITRAQADKLVAAAASPHMRLFTLLAIYTGARAGAILDLTWDRVTERFIDYNRPDRPTGRKRRAVVPTHPELWTELQAARQGAVTDHVIEYGGERIASVKKAFQRQAKRAGLDHVGPHTIRHSVATWLAMDDVSMRKIADLLGNSEKMVEKVYAKFAPGYLADAVESLGRGQVVQMNRSLAHKDGTAPDIASSGARKRK